MLSRVLPRFEDHEERVDLAALEDSSIVPKGVGEAKYVPERDAIFATCDRLDCRPPNKPFPSEHEPCRRVTS